MYKDRVEIRNPGGLYGRLTVDQLGKVRPDTRNPILARALETLGFTENRYSGIPTIQREMRAAGMEEALFTDHKSEFIVTFYNGDKRVIEKAESKNKTLLDFCKEPKSRQEIAEFVGLSTVYYAMQNYVRPLLETGELKMTIPKHPRSKNQKYYS